MSQLTQIGKYKILSELGRGGMGVVYRAEDRFIGREVAIKTLADATPEMRQRFAIEARSGVLNHPNIVTIYDFGEHEGNPYIVMEFLHGLTLERIVKEGQPLGLVDKLEIVRQVCEGLGYAHSRGVIHRDIKPANVIMLPNGCAKLVDFGIAQLETLSGHTMAGSVIGTYQYLSPERLKGEPSDGRADIWSAGVLLYLLLTGTLPFPGEDISALHRVITDPYPPLATHLSTAYPESLDNIVARALAKDPTRRYPTALEMAGDLEATRDAIRLSKVEDLLGQVRTLIDKDELLRARPLLLDLQRLAPQNTAVRNMLRELQDRLAHQPELHATTAPAHPFSQAGTDSTNGRPAPGTSPAEPGQQEEERRQRIIDQIVVEIRAEADRGHEARALDLVHRSLERAPQSAALLALRTEIEARISAVEPVIDQPGVEQPQAAAQAEITTPEPAFERAVSSPFATTSEPAQNEVPANEPTHQLESGPEPAGADFGHATVLESTPANVGAEPAHPSEVHSKATLPSFSEEADSEESNSQPQVNTGSFPALQAPEHNTSLQASSPAQESASTAASSYPVPTQGLSAPLGVEVPAVPADIDSQPATDPRPAGPLTASVPVLSAPSLLEPATDLSSATSKEVAPPSSANPVSASPAAQVAPKEVPKANVSAQPQRSRLVLYALGAVMVLLFGFILIALTRHHASPTSLPTTYAQVIASPYAQVLGLSADNGEAVALPAGDHTTPLRIDHLRPGNYTLQLERAGGQKVEAHCTVNAEQHLCSAASEPLSDTDMQNILNGGSR